jgi:hypothetical protein
MESLSQLGIGRMLLHLARKLGRIGTGTMYSSTRKRISQGVSLNEEIRCSWAKFCVSAGIER